VLVSVPDMECGFSRDLFVMWAPNPLNSIIFTTRTSPGTLSRHLIDNPRVSAVDMEACFLYGGVSVDKLPYIEAI